MVKKTFTTKQVRINHLRESIKKMDEKGIGKRESMIEIDFLKEILRDLENNQEIIKSRIRFLEENPKEEITTRYSTHKSITENSQLDLA